MRTRRQRRSGSPRTVRAEPLEPRRLLSTVVVNTTADQADAPGSGVVSLRDAVALANAAAEPTTIEFASSPFATFQTITLDGTPLRLSNTAQPTTIVGPTVSSQGSALAISGDDKSAVFVIDGGVTATLSDLDVTFGDNQSGDGGGIDNLGTANLTEDTFDYDSAEDGGGIYNAGTLSLLDSTVTEDGAPVGAGGIDSTAAATLYNDTISGNNSAAGTGGLRQAGVATLAGVTITGNQGEHAGGLDAGGGQTTIGNSIVAGNTDETAFGVAAVPDVYGPATSNGYNLIGATDGSSGWGGSDLTGTAAQPLSPDLGALGDNGGPTRTALPQPASPALGHGSLADVPGGVTTDQRGYTRTVGGVVDIGAVEADGTPAGGAPVGGTASADEPTTTALRINADVLRVGLSSQFDVTVVANNPNLPVPTGTVSIYEDGNLKGTYALADGKVDQPIAPTPTPMQTQFTAVYSGDAEFAPSTSDPVRTLIVAPSAFVPSAPNLPVSVVPELAGAAIRVSDPVKFTNSGAKLSGTFKFAFDVNTSSVGLDADPSVLESFQRRLTVNAGRSFAVTLTARKLPASLTPGTYYFVAEMTDPDGGYAFSTVPTPISVVAPVVTITATATAVRPATLTSKLPGAVVVSVVDTGNVAAAGPLTVTVLPSADGTTADGTTPLATLGRRVTIKAGRTGRYTLHVRVPATLAAGPYYPLVSVSLDGAVTAATGSRFAVAGG